MDKGSPLALGTVDRHEHFIDHTAYHPLLIAELCY
jgi:hypothetical protein